MDFSLSEDQEALRELARKILEDRATHERIKEVERSPEQFDRALWNELAKANLLGACLPEAHGGGGLGLLELCLLLEEAGRTVAPIPLWATLALGALPIAQFGTADQKRRYLAGVVDGSLFLSGALEEEGSDDPARPATRAEREGSAWRLSGVKICVPAAHIASAVLVSARTAAGGIGLFLLDPRAQRVALEPQPVTNHQPHFRMTLAGARVEADSLLGDPGHGAELLEWTCQRAIAGLCALQVGIAERALRMTAEYTTGRKQFDRPIGSFQAVHQRAGDAYVDVEAMRLTTWQAAFRLARGLPAHSEVAVAKYWAAEGGSRVTYAAQHLHGGIGMDLDYPLHRYYLWARQLELTLGSASVHLERLGDQLARG